MLIVILFLVISVLTFVAVWFVTRPSKSEVALQERLLNVVRNPLDASIDSDDILKRESYSDLPLADLILSRLAITESLQQLIKQANSNWTVGRVIFGSLLLLAAGSWIAGLWLHNFPVGAVVGLVLSSVPYLTLRMKRGARLRRFNSLLPEAIDLMSRALRAGHAVTAAIEMVAKEISDPVGTEFRRAFEEQNFGLPLREALLNLAKRVPIDDVKFLVTAILVQKETGGNLAEVLDKTAAVLRERMRLLGQLRIHTAQGRLTGWILGLLPFIVFGLLNFINPGYARILLEDPLGQKLVWAGLVLMAFGIWVIRKIVDIKV
ncbi:MAG TPA: type II secretion system F family protein [Clostridia bacterium]|nr:type II secretion system F family protein [Clostridia bacterium]